MPTLQRLLFQMVIAAGLVATISVARAQDELGLIVPALDPFAQAMVDAGVQTAESLQRSLSVNQVQDSQQEIATLRSFLNRGITSVVIDPIDPDVIAAFLREAESSGYPMKLTTIGAPIDGAETVAPPSSGEAEVLGEWARQQLQDRPARVLPLESFAGDDLQANFSQSFGSAYFCAPPASDSSGDLYAAIQGCSNPDIVITKTPLGAVEAMDALPDDLTSLSSLFISIGSGCLAKEDLFSERVDATLVPRPDLLVTSAITALASGTSPDLSTLDVASILVADGTAPVQNIPTVSTDQIDDICPLLIPSACCTKGNKTCCPRK